MLGNRPHFPPKPYGFPYGPHVRTISPIEYKWKSLWPYRISTVLGALILFLAVILIVLEIALLAIIAGGVEDSVYSSGVGIWSGLIIVVAGVLILILKWVKSVRLWAFIALIATAVATVFAIIEFSINARRVQLAAIYGAFGSSISQAANVAGLAAAQLAFGLAVFLLCVAFIGLYVSIASKISSRRSDRQRQQIVYPVQPM